MPEESDIKIDDNGYY